MRSSRKNSAADCCRHRGTLANPEFRFHGISTDFCVQLASKSGWIRMPEISKRLEILDQVHPFFLRELVAERMAALTHSGPRGVDDELGLKWRPSCDRGELI